MGDVAVYECPDCEGKGHVPEEFYGNEQGLDVSLTYTDCLNCSGEGLVLVDDPEPYAKYVDPWGEWDD